MLGFTFKENCTNTRNTRVIDIVKELREYEVDPIVIDPVADQEEAFHEYGIELASYSEIKDMDAVIIAVSYEEFKNLNKDDLDKRSEEHTSELQSRPHLVCRL